MSDILSSEDFRKIIDDCGESRALAAYTPICFCHINNDRQEKIGTATIYVEESFENMKKQSQLQTRVTMFDKDFPDTIYCMKDDNILEFIRDETIDSNSERASRAEYEKIYKLVHIYLLDEATKFKMSVLRAREKPSQRLLQSLKDEGRLIKVI